MVLTQILFGKECVAKLVYFCTFMYDDDSILNDVGLELDVTMKFRALMIKLLNNYCWEFDYSTLYCIIVDVTVHSNIVTKMVDIRI